MNYLQYPRQLAFLNFPFWLIVILSDSESVALFAALSGTILFVKWFNLTWRKQPRNLELLKLSAASLFLMVNLSWLMAVCFGYISYNITFTELLKKEVGCTVAEYALAIIYVLLFIIILDLTANFKWLHNAQESAKTKLLKLNVIDTKQLFFILVLMCAGDLLLLASGYFGYRGYNVEGYAEGYVAWYIPFFSMMIWAQVAFNALFLIRINIEKRNRFYYLFFITSVSLTTFILSMMGRRELITVVVLSLFWYIFFSGAIPRVNIKIIIIAIIIGPILFQAFLVFNFIRGSEIESSFIKDASIVDIVQVAYVQFNTNSTNKAEEQLRTAQNLATRPLVLNPLARAQSLPTKGKEFLFGENLLNSFIWAVPRILFKDKSDYLVLEDLMNRNFPIGNVDTSNSAYLDSYLDYGWLGIFIYPLVLAFLWCIALLLINYSKLAPMFSLVYATVFIQLFILQIGESSMIQWFCTIRDSILIFPIFIVISNTIKNSE